MTLIKNNLLKKYEESVRYMKTENKIDVSDNLSIVVSSCDLYEDAWMPFFKLLDIHWPECHFPKILISEEKEYNCDFMNITTITTGNELSWTERLHYALNKVESEYILFFLEDFFITQKVNITIFNEALELMEKDEKIGVIKFPPGSKKWKFPEKNDMNNCFSKVKINEPYRTKVGVSLWRKEYFVKLLYGQENPWEYEKEGSIRSVFAGYKVYTQNYDCCGPVFLYYINPKDGMGITRRKWLKDNKGYFEEQGILDVNYDRLGIEEETFTYRMLQKEYTEESKKNYYDYISLLKGIEKYREILYSFKHKYFIKLFRIDKIKKYIFYWKYYSFKYKKN